MRPPPNLQSLCSAPAFVSSLNIYQTFPFSRLLHFEIIVAANVLSGDLDLSSFLGFALGHFVSATEQKPKLSLRYAIKRELG